MPLLLNRIVPEGQLHERVMWGKSTPEGWGRTCEKGQLLVDPNDVRREPPGLGPSHDGCK
jgi:hypothetical protein